MPKQKLKKPDSKTSNTGTKTNNNFYARCKVKNYEIIVGAWDTETDGLGGKLLSICWGSNLTGIVFDASENMIHNFITYILDFPSPFVWYAHFSQYDWRYIMDYLHDNEMQIEICMRTDNDVYQIVIAHNKKKIILRDSYAVYNNKLELLANEYCPELPKLKIDIENYDAKNPEHIEYAKRDVLILITALPRYFNLIRNNFGIETGATIAGNSVKAWQMTMDFEEIYNASRYDETELFIREAYFGGIVFLTSTNVQRNAITLDINSSYPDIMCTKGVPSGKRIRTTNYKLGQPGIYRCRVKAPDNLIIPIIPARNKVGSMRWYSGEFDTVCTNIELIFAANHGYEIIKIYEGIAWEKMIFPFNTHIDHCKTIRKSHKGKPEEKIAKDSQNSLYGKFAAKREKRLISPSYMLSDDQIMGTTIICEITGDKKGRLNDGWIPYDKDGKWFFKKELDKKLKCIPEWSVFITANARIKLLTAAYAAGVENVFYGDTDSLTLRKGSEKLIDIGNEYGQWKLEKTWQKFRAIAPKIYSGILENNKFVGAAKGLPRKNLGDTQWRQLLEDGKTSAEALSLQSLRATLKHGVNPAKPLTRKSGNVANSQNFQVDTKGNVRVKIAA